MSVTIPKGTVLHLYGVPVELVEDTPVNSKTIEGYESFEAFEQQWKQGETASAWKENLQKDVDGQVATLQARQKEMEERDAS